MIFVSVEKPGRGKMSSWHGARRKKNGSALDLGLAESQVSSVSSMLRVNSRVKRAKESRV